MPILTVTANTDYSIAPNNALVNGQNITQIQFSGGGTATVSSTQFGGSNISNSLVLAGDASINTFIVVIPTTGGTINASNWTFSGWTASLDPIRLTGSRSADTIIGSTGNDSITGGNGVDSLNGGDGSDLFVYANGQGVAGEIVDGGNGSDSLLLAAGASVDFSQMTLSNLEAVVFDQSGGTVSFEGSQIGLSSLDLVSGDGTSAVSTLNVTGGTVVLSLAFFQNWQDGVDRIFINGLATSSLLAGSNLADTITGGAGDDTIQGDAGADSLNGGDGNDFIQYTDSSFDASGETINGGIGTDTLTVSFSGSYDFRNASITGMERLKSSVSGENVIVHFSNTQVGAGSGLINYFEETFSGIPNDVIYVYGGSVDLSTATITGFSGFGFSGSSAADTIIGSSINDTIQGGDGIDSLAGGGGSDIFTFSAESEIGVGETINGGSGSDTIFLQFGSSSINFSSMNISSIENFLMPFSASNVVFLDVQIGSSSGRISQIVGQSLFLGQLNDVVTVNGASVDLTGVTLIDILRVDINGTGNADVLTGSSQGDNITAGNGVDQLSGGDGADTLNGGADGDVMLGGDGSDFYFVDSAGDFAIESNANQATGGYDIVTASVNFTLGANVEQLVLTGAATQGTGNSGANYLYGGSSFLSLRLDGADGDDVIYSGLAGTNTIIGGAGVDTLLIYGGNNQANGGLGSDIYYTYTASDVLSEVGGDGIDTVYSNHDIVLAEDLEQLLLYGSATTASSTSLDDNNIMYGNSATGAVSMDGGGGADVLIGGLFNDTLIGGAGVDLLFGYGGNNDLRGGADTDIYYLENTTTTVIELVGGGFDTVYSNASGTTTLAANVEQLILYGAATGGTGTSGNDYLYGNSSANALILDGAGGNDYILGSAQNDTLIGGLGNDQINLLIGGNDFVRYNAAGNMGADSILSFDADPTGGQDQIQLSGLGYTGASIGSAITIAASGGNTLVTFTSGNLAGTTINLVGVAVANVTATDFVF